MQLALLKKNSMNKFKLMPLHEDTTRYTAPPDTYDKDPNEYHAAHILQYIHKSIPDHNREYELHEVIEILQYAIGYIEDEDIGIDAL